MDSKIWNDFASYAGQYSCTGPNGQAISRSLINEKTRIDGQNAQLRSQNGRYTEQINAASVRKRALEEEIASIAREKLPFSEQLARIRGEEAQVTSKIRQVNEAHQYLELLLEEVNGLIGEAQKSSEESLPDSLLFSRIEQVYRKATDALNPTQ